MSATERTEKGNGLEPPRSVILAAAEAAPFAKLGGLGDVTTALAGALAAAGLHVTVLLPAYASIDRRQHALRALPESVSVPLGSRWETCGLLQGEIPGTTARVVCIDHPGYFGRPGIYTDPDTGLEYADAVERWTFFSRAILAVLPALGTAPDILHVNDHHCALAAALRTHGSDPSRPFLRRTAVVLGIHNLGYQGIYDAQFLPLTGLPAHLMAPTQAMEFWGRMNYMKAGLVCSDALTTVSPTYAREIQESEAMGYGLEGVLQSRREALFGILNGIDTEEWNPAADPLLPAAYDASDLAGKGICKAALQQRSGLPVAPGIPLFGMISRLVDQKGVDLLLEALPRLLEMPLQCVVLGRGLPRFETQLRHAAREHPTRLAVHLEQDESLAHWIEAGCDFFLMPSRYEPCGLNQMYSMRYGTVPIVRRTGGLADTVRDWDGRQGTGFLFDAYSAEALEGAVLRALEAYGAPSQVALLRRAGMTEDFSWNRSATRYRQVYTRALTWARRGTGSDPAALGH